MGPRLFLSLFFLFPLFLSSQQETTVFLEARYKGAAKRLDSILVEDLIGPHHSV